MADTLIRDNKDYGSVGEFLKDVVKVRQVENVDIIDLLSLLSLRFYSGRYHFRGGEIEDGYICFRFK